jgi:hypothetical protein
VTHPCTIQFAPNALGSFSNVAFGNENPIANHEGKGGPKQNGKLGSGFLKPFRRPPEDKDTKTAVTSDGRRETDLRCALRAEQLREGNGGGGLTRRRGET